jgi:thioredoxin reductase
MVKPADVLIVGGGPAGLAAAMALGRMLKSALICDDARPRNAASSHANNLPGFDGVNPAEWRAKVRQELAKYRTIEFFEGTVLSVTRENQLFVAELANGEKRSFRKVILAHGIVDRLPEAPGFRELWGKSVFHCPYCHGFEVRGKRLGVVANGMFAEHLTPMVSALSADVILFTQGKALLDPATLEAFKKRGLQIVESHITALDYSAEKLHSVACGPDLRFGRDALFLGPMPPLVMKSSIGENLSCEKNYMGFFKVDEMRRTTVPGVFAAGDIMSMAHSVAGAVAAGQMAGPGAVMELVT